MVKSRDVISNIKITGGWASNHVKYTQQIPFDPYYCTIICFSPIFRLIKCVYVLICVNVFKDNLLDLEVAKQGPDPKDMEEKVIKIGVVLDDMQTRFARLLAQHEATQSRLKKRVTRLESKITTSTTVTLTELAGTEPGVPHPAEEEKKDEK